MFSKMKFTTKLYVSVACCLFFSIVILTLFSVYKSKNSLLSLGKDSVASTGEAIYQTAHMLHGILQDKLKEDLKIMEQEIENIGSFYLDKNNLINTTIVNQVSKEKEEVSIPALVLGGKIVFNNFELVDKVKEMVGGTATIFQVLPGKLLRVSTNVLKLDGSRAVGTYIPDTSPVYKTVMAGKTYYGKAFVVNDWYLTAYKPMKDALGNIVSVIYVGVKILSPEFKQFLAQTKAAGVGYCFIYDSTGQFLYHPNPEVLKKNIFQLPGDIGEAYKKARDKDFVNYTWQGEKKVSYVRYFEPWDWYFGVGLTEKQMIKGLDVELLGKNLLAGIVLLGVSILVVFVIIRFINKSLMQVAALSEKVAQGDYRVSFSYAANDAIGILVNSFNTLVKHTKDMLREIIEGTEQVSLASSEVNQVAREVADSSKEMKQKANKVTEATAENVDNLNSVSAAMEQLATNANTIASAAEEMSATITEIASNTEKAKEITSSAVSKAGVVSSKVNELGGAAAEISFVTETIAAISSQTNLLALNATIEAARAGEAGKGFAVVANEIKELAQQTAKATEDIKEKVQGIQGATDITVKEIEEITTIIAEMDQIVSTIAAAIEEQSVTTRDIADNVGQVSMAVGESNESLSRVVEQTREVQAEVEGVATTSDDLSRNSGSLEQSAKDLASLSARLKELVSRFKID
ncbi:MAG: hypothetical protein PWR24_1451 [Desulfonauticus sp.]|jgi:methyl-accepting chemotaxis protein|nr:hypothetical protein [Desulfonauticus sp.]